MGIFVGATAHLIAIHTSGYRIRRHGYRLWLGGQLVVFRHHCAGVRIFGECDKSVGFTIEGVDRAGFDVVNLSMQGQVTPSSRSSGEGLEQR